MNWGMKVLQTFALPLGHGTRFLYEKKECHEHITLLFGAGDEARTRYLHLGKVALYQMSYTRIWCLRSELNQRHADFQSAALPTELQRHVESRRHPRLTYIMATRNRLELSTSSVTGWRANRLHHRARYVGGKYRARTCDPLLVRQVLSQLS